MIRQILLLSLLLYLANDILKVDGAKCKKCKACGEGARCSKRSCKWCTGFCHKTKKSSKRQKRSTEVTYGSFEMAYKIPLVEMLNDFEEEINNMESIEILDFFKDILESTSEDCGLCDYPPELVGFSNFTSFTYNTLTTILDDSEFKNTALEKTKQTIYHALTLPESIKIQVEENNPVANGVPGELNYNFASLK